MANLVHYQTIDIIMKQGLHDQADRSYFRYRSGYLDSGTALTGQIRVFAMKLVAELLII